MMTCQVCNHKMTKTFTKKAYHTGVVIINCDNCDNNHLIADNLGWFREKSVNIEDLAQEKGDQAIKVQNHPRLQQILKGLKFVGNKDTILPENENHAEKENVENQGKVFEIEDVQKQSNEKK